MRWPGEPAEEYDPEAAELQQGIHALKLEQEMAMEGYERDNRVIKSRYSTAAEKKSARAANQRRLNAAGQYVSPISAKNKKLEAIRVSYSSGCLTQYFPPSYRALWESYRTPMPVVVDMC